MSKLSHLFVFLAANRTFVSDKNQASVRIYFLLASDDKKKIDMTAEDLNVCAGNWGSFSGQSLEYLQNELGSTQKYSANVRAFFDPLLEIKKNGEVSNELYLAQENNLKLAQLTLQHL